jgi:penicillin-binding protein 2
LFREFLEILRELAGRIKSTRIIIIGVIYALMIWVMLSKLYSMQIVNGESYLTNYIQKTERTVSLPATRGNIYDCNGKILAYNRLAYNVTIQDNGDYKTSSEKNLMLLKLVRILQKHDKKVEGELEIGLDDSGAYYFTSNGNDARKRFLRDFYGLKKTDELDDAAGKYPSDVDAETLIAAKFKSYGLDKLKDKDGKPVELTPLEKLQVINIRYTMSLTAYQKYEITTVARNVDEDTRTEILEEKSDLLGVDIAQTTERAYNDSIPFASIIGYTGKIQASQISGAGSGTQNDYSPNDTVGRTGIEGSMEADLKGTKGSRTMFVDNVGHIMEITSETQPEAGTMFTFRSTGIFRWESIIFWKSIWPAFWQRNWSIRKHRTMPTRTPRKG